MDVEEIRRILFTRLQLLDPDHAFKIMGFLLLHDCSHHDLHRLVLGPDSLLLSLISTAKKELGLLASRHDAVGGGDPDFFLPSAAASMPAFSHSPAAPMASFLKQHQQHLRPIPYPHASQKWSLPPPSLPPFDNADYLSGHAFFKHQDDDASLALHVPRLYSCPSSFSLSPPSDVQQQIGYRTCLFFSRGYCKHGSSCRFSHSAGDADKAASSPHSLFADIDAESSGSDDSHSQSFETLEQELRELLRGKKTPVSIASLPQMYYDRFGKSLQAEGYLTESQRHGKTGFSLTRLLMRLRGTVRLIERPHGQHAVMLLEEDAARDDMNASSRQIYLTFPAESSFTEEDVTIHFRAYGPVQDVRIPYQQKRMFGFVTFVHPDTVRTILTEGNPHYICGARVLVKPYKEKAKVTDNKWKSHDRESSKHALPANGYPASNFSRSGHDINLIMQDENAGHLEQKLTEIQLDGINDRLPKMKLADDSTVDKDLSEFDSADGCSMSSNNFKYVLDLLDCESKDVENTDSTVITAPRANSKFLDLSLGMTDTIDTTAHSIQKVRSNHWSNQNTHARQHGWGATATLFARSVF